MVLGGLFMCLNFIWYVVLGCEGVEVVRILLVDGSRGLWFRREVEYSNLVSLRVGF